MHFANKASVLLLLATAAFFAQSPSAHATTNLYASASTVGTGNGTINSGTGPITSYKTRTSGLEYGSSSASVTVDYGSILVSGDTNVLDTNSNNVIWAGGQGYFSDDLTINAPGLVGTTGTATVKFTISGTYSATAGGGDEIYGQAEATASFYFRKNGSTLASGEHTLYWDGTSAGTSFLGLEQSATFSFIYGTPFEIRMSIDSSGRAYNMFGGQSHVSVESSWDGFDSVYDGQGNLVTNYSVSSTSNGSYLQTVPEPGSALLVLGGALCAVLRRRPRTRS